MVRRKYFKLNCATRRRFARFRWPDNVRLSDLEPRFTSQAFGNHGANVRPDFNWDWKRPDERQKRLSAAGKDHDGVLRLLGCCFRSLGVILLISCTCADAALNLHIQPRLEG
jgi:hypothetical protein